MNHSVIKRTVGLILMFEAAFMLLPIVTSIIYGEKQGIYFAIVAAASLLIGWLLQRKKTDNQPYYAKEGFVMVALCWIVMSMVGALPFTLCGDIPGYLDALFETISGFTTTGASILHDVEALSHASLIWRSFTHWIGGMGVIVFILAILPMGGGYSMHLMRAESPGPSVGKLVPRIKDTAKILYTIYFVLTVVQIILLIIARMPVFDALCITFGSAGTGGFGIKNDSLASYSAAVQIITTVFMILFGINFNAYFFLLGRDKKQAFKMEEVRWYIGIILAAIILISINIYPSVKNLGETVNQASFQVASIITTTGYSTTDFDLWPEFSKTILVILMFIGACAGSTGGGIKVSRILIAFKKVGKEIKKIIHPRSVNIVMMDGKALDAETSAGVSMYLITYIFIFFLSLLIVSLNNLDFTSNFTAVAATFNNIGPGLSKVGPACNFDCYNSLSKIVLMFDMLAGRLELYPMLILLTPSIWRKNG